MTNIKLMMKQLIQLNYVIWLLYFLCSTAVATQLSFSQQDRILHYVWTDSEQTRHQVTVDTSQIQFTLTTFKRYSPKLMQQALQQQVMQWFQQQQITDVQLKRERVGLNYELQIIGSDPERVKEISNALRQQQNQAYQDYLTQHHFQMFKNFSNQWAIKPDHTAIALLSQADITPLANAFKPLIADKTEMEGTALLLSFIQSIPYSALGADNTQRGTGFSPPAQLLINNQGDCDSKVTLMASLMMQLYPKREAIMVIVPGHALIGIDLPKQGRQRSLTVQGRTYVLAEPTGPANFLLGEIDNASAVAIAQQQTRIERFIKPTLP
ncbi:hypothetical protein K6Y31_06900 [Motilimonas cestriensis]|uniref:Transglutaminase domain-containing protein n=1 Tax=Motilimonas cestriensis TaxID=2742685 RepID=A0ABS8W6D0_9GAMM|nr:hypothetical protein [Motilimonas cestriensis]MCE2594539.1 hypothetical protein [Motilimonas cestriensis]